MDSIDLIRENLHRSRSIVLSRIDDMRDHCLVQPSPNGGCHTLWILGHLAFVEGFVVNQVMQGKKNPRGNWQAMFDGSDVSSKCDDFVSFEEALEACQLQREETLTLLASFEEADLDQISSQCPKGNEHLFGTYRQCFQYCADHWLMHRGQLADARRAAGVQKMWY